MSLCGTYGIDPRDAERWTPAEFSAYVDGAAERKKDTDLRLAQIAVYVGAAAGAKGLDAHRVAGYRREASVLDFDPDAGRELALEKRERDRVAQQEREHKEWLASVGMTDGE